VYPGATVVNRGPKLWPRWDGQPLVPAREWLAHTARLALWGAAVAGLPVRDWLARVDPQGTWSAGLADRAERLASEPDPLTSTEPPTLPCPTCGGEQWHRAWDGWACSRCHPASFAVAGDAGSDAEQARDDDRDALLALAAAAGWPSLPLRPAVAVAAGEDNWRRFVTTASAADLAFPQAGLEAVPATGASPTGGCNRCKRRPWPSLRGTPEKPLVPARRSGPVKDEINTGTATEALQGETLSRRRRDEE